jgi:steroid delta-isomerase-like uncharacterized protein
MLARAADRSQTGCFTRGYRVINAEDRIAQERAIDDWAQAWSSHDVEALLALHTADALVEDVARGAVFRGKDQLRAFAEAFVAGYPDVTFTLTSRFIAGDHGSAEWVMRGTHLGDRPGLRATGKQVEVRGVSIFEFAHSKIRRCSDYCDMATLLKQVGLMPTA